MKVLIPRYKETLFIDEIIKAYKPYCEIHAGFNNFWLNQGKYDIIHLHWPEYLFKWLVPTDTELLLLKRILKEWQQQGTKIVITRHNYLPHRPQPERYIPLYNSIYAIVDAVIHMGKHSEIEYVERYKNLIPKHQVQAQIPHPIFTHYPNTVSKKEARKHLNIGSSTKVMLVFGEVRKANEKNLVLEAFDAIDGNNKLLLAPGWKFSEGKEPVNRFKWFKVKKSKKYRITQEYIEDDEVQYFFKAADFVFLPRVDTLNSGVPFLAAVYNTPIVGCNTGNIGENLKNLGMPVFERLYSAKIQSGINQVLLIAQSQNNYTVIKQQNSAKVVGEQHIKLFESLMHV